MGLNYWKLVLKRDDRAGAGVDCRPIHLGLNYWKLNWLFCVSWVNSCRPIHLGLNYWKLEIGVGVVFVSVIRSPHSLGA